jgi:hypothetical protein
MKSLLAAMSVVAILASGPLAAQQAPTPGGAPQPPATVPPAAAPQPPSTLPQPDRAPATIREPTVPRPASPDRPMPDGVSDPARVPGAGDDALRRGGRISETAPAPRAVLSTDTRFREDMRRCDAMDAGSRTSCRQEMSAARAQGLYRN